MKKKIVTVALAAFCSTALFAQKMTYDAGRTTFGVRGGVNFQTLTGKDAAGTRLDNNVLTGFNAGVNAEIPIGTGFYVQPGVLYSMKGAELNNDDRVKLSYVEVPVNLVYKPVLGTGRLLLGFGPYAAFGISGKVEGANGNDTKIEFANKVNTQVPGTTYLKNLDAGANFLAGYEFANNFSFQLNAQLGLVDIRPEFQTATNNNGRLNNTGFGVSVGYRF